MGWILLSSNNGENISGGQRGVIDWHAFFFVEKNLLLADEVTATLDKETPSWYMNYYFLFLLC